MLGYLLKFFVAFNNEVVLYCSEVQQRLFFNNSFLRDPVATETTELGIRDLIKNTSIKYHLSLLLDFLLGQRCLLEPL